MEFQSEAENLMQSAESLAKNFIIDEKINRAELKEKYGAGVSDENVSFGYKFATACAEYAVKLVSESKNPIDSLDNVSKRFGRATLLLNDSQFAYALESFKNKIAEDVTEFSTAKTDGRDINGNIRRIIACAIHSLDECDNTKRNILIAVISDFDKISGGEKMNSHKKKLR